jgi:4-alpha-glucanotransferase
MLNQRSSGILMHPTSLPGKYGIGTLGDEAFRFIDFLRKSEQKLWQILPLGPTGYADSPYQCFSSAAGNPLMIDTDLLVKERLLEPAEISPLEEPGEGPVNYESLEPVKLAVLRKAFDRFLATESRTQKKGFQNFISLNAAWINDYSLFMALREHFSWKPWNTWEKPVRMRDPKTLQHFQKMLSDKIEFQKFIQYLFFRQWFTVRDYAHKNRIRIIGDIPIYVSYDSADVWTHPEIFQLNEELLPTFVGGVPPDYFSETGQLWGNPLYNWDVLLKQGCSWWIDRIRNNMALYDVVRIDHFRGFAAYWSVPYGEETAVNGKWVPCPGDEFFECLENSLGDLSFIAEDLGVITEDVEKLRDTYGFPGMKILQFAFDSSEANDHLPYNFKKNSVVYTGTHDNDTIRGWFESAGEDDRQFLLDYLNTGGSDISWDLIRLAWSSIANTSIVPVQDLLGLGNEARMNLPGTVGNNWKWRAPAGCFTDELAQKLAHITEVYGRAKRRLKTKESEK